MSEKPKFTLDLPPKKAQNSSGSTTKRTKSKPSKEKTISLPTKLSTPKLPSEKRLEDHAKKQSTLDGVQNVVFHLDEVMPAPTNEQLAEAETTLGTGRDTVKQMQVTLEYNKSTVPLNYWPLIMECFEDRICDGHARDKDADYWFQTMNNLGSLPMRTLFKDTDRFLLCLYAACFIHANKLTFGSEADARNPGPDLGNKDFDPYEENVAQDGKHWGMRVERTTAPKTNVAPAERQEARVSEEAKALLEKSSLKGRASDKVMESNMKGFLDDSETDTVRTQVQDQKREDLEKFLGQSDNMKQLEAIRATSPDTYVQKWAIAENLARKPKEAWENAPYELVQMVKYCYGWLRDKGSVPYYPKDLIEVWWKRPTWEVMSMTPEAIVRRDAIVEKVRQFWVKSVEASPKDKINLRTESYRKTLAAMHLENLIERYARGEDVAVPVREAAMQYFHAHFNINDLGVKPGPKNTLDPDFTGYMKLCQKYDLEVGTLLHEADI